MSEYGWAFAISIPLIAAIIYLTYEIGSYERTGRKGLARIPAGFRLAYDLILLALFSSLERLNRGNQLKAKLVQDHKPADQIKRMSVAEFRRLGLLQEVNRQFLHPRGLALEVIIDEDKEIERFGEVWDYRDDPEGMAFGDPPSTEAKDYADRLRQDHKEHRKEKFGWIVQPAGRGVKR